MEEAWGTMEPYENYVNDYKNVANENATNNLTIYPKNNPKIIITQLRQSHTIQLIPNN